jgi:hypothetical protein
MTPRLGQRLERRAKQFIAEAEGSESDDNDDTDALLQHLMAEDPDASFFTEQGSLEGDMAREIFNSLCTSSTLHAITHSVPAPKYDPGQGHYSRYQFFGILVDTGAAKHSTCGYGQFLALKSMTRAELDTEAPRHGFRFGIGNTTSLGSTPADNL